MSIYSRFIKIIKDFFTFCSYLLSWIKNIALSKKMDECLSCDPINRIWFFVFFPFFFSVIIQIFGTFISQLPFNMDSVNIYLLILANLVKILLSISIFFLLVSIILSYTQYKESLKAAKLKPEFDSDKPHHGIIFTRYNKLFDDISILDCIHLLVKDFHGTVPYKIYTYNSFEEFVSIYSNPKIKWLWIFGHGDRGGICYLKRDISTYIEYSRLKPNPSIEFIAQLHCNAGEKTSLLEINQLTADHDISHWRWPYQNRCYIMKKINEFGGQKYPV